MINAYIKKEEIFEISKRMLKKTQQRLESMDITIEFDEEVIRMISDEGFDPVYGARPLRRAIQSKIEDKLSEQMLDEKIIPGKSYRCVLENGEVKFISQE